MCPIGWRLMLLALLTASVTIVAGAMCLLTAYLLMLGLAAAWGKAHAPSPARSTPRRRFAVLIPAHNEEALIGRLLDNLQHLDYPRNLYEVCVVADNCDDRTAALAQERGASVFERFDLTHRAKGFALRWLIEQLRGRGADFDAYVVLDADSVVSANFLRSMDARLADGSLVIQAHYSVLNPHESALAGLRGAALAAVHYLRPMGRLVLGLSCGLKGNGMCFAGPIIERFGWDWYTLAEDVEFHLALVRQGIRVDFAPEASVMADMPVTLRQAASQNDRWERGRLQLVREHVPRLLLDGFRLGSFLRLDAAVEQLIPPLSVPFAVAALCVVGLTALGSTVGMWVAALALLGQVAYLLAALALVGAPRTSYLALGAAPIYIAWKLGLYSRALVNTRSTAWVRTARTTQR
jgi:cellulose synthase/poly-beta-1,6-N-acetylglucosamine synthase-like glycosyltransferase